MKTQSKIIFVSFAFFCVSLFGANTSFAQENKTLAQVQTQFATSQWEVAVSDGKAHRILRIKDISQELPNTFLAVAEYGFSDEPLSGTAVEITQTSTGQTLKFATPANNIVTAVEQSDGSFSGSFTSQKGKEKQVKLTKLQVDSGPITPIAEGDLIAGQFYKASGTTNIEFSPVTAPKVFAKIHFTENGDQQYLVDGQVALAYDKHLTRIVTNGKPESVRFVLFPQDQPLQPGMKWDVPAMQLAFNCGLVKMNFKADSKTGPEVVITINGQKRTVSTIEVHYEASMMNTCAGSWKRITDVQYSPELNAIVGNKILNLDPTGKSLLNEDGSNWAMTEVRRAGKQIAGQ